MRSATGRARSSAPTWPAHTQGHLAHVHASACTRRRARRSARTAARGGSAAGATRGRPALFCVLGAGDRTLRCDPLLAREMTRYPDTPSGVLGAVSAVRTAISAPRMPHGRTRWHAVPPRARQCHTQHRRAVERYRMAVLPRRGAPRSSNRAIPARKHDQCLSTRARTFIRGREPPACARSDAVWPGGAEVQTDCQTRDARQQA